MDETPTTRAGLARLSEELERLREAAAAAGSADRELLEQRIERLEQRLGAARMADEPEVNGVVELGERVRLRDLDTGERLRVELVGRFEADPFAGRVSVASPIGQALLGLRAGEVAVVDAPRGRRRLKVLAVEEARSFDVA